MAVHAHRALLFRWSADAPLEDLLEPVNMDWRVKDSYQVGGWGAEMLAHTIGLGDRAVLYHVQSDSGPALSLPPSSRLPPRPAPPPVPSSPDRLPPPSTRWLSQVDSISDTTVYTWGKGDPLPEQLASSEYTQDPSRLISVTHSDQDCNGRA